MRKSSLRYRLVTGAARGCAAAPFCVLASLPAFAGDWSSDVGASLRTTYETNPELTTSNKRSNEQAIFSPFIESRYEAERGRATFNASTDIVRSSDKRIRANTESYDIGVDAERDFERSTLSAGAAWSRVEFQNSDFDETQLLFTTDPNINTTEDSVDELNLNARYDHELSARTSVFVSDDFRDVRFSAPSSTNFTDNEFEVGASYEHAEGLVYIPSVGYEIFDPEGQDAVDVYRGEIGVEYTPSETEFIRFAPGVVQVDDKMELTLDAEYTQQFELFSVTANASRNLEPDDDGDLRQTTRAGVSATRDLSLLTSISGNVDWVETDNSEIVRIGSTLSHQYSEFVATGVSVNWRRQEVTDSSGVDSTEITAGPYVSWVINEELNTRLSYTGIREKESGSDAAYSHLFALALNYSLALD